jgi:hypothetical protein
LITERSYGSSWRTGRGIGGVLVSVNGTAVDLELLTEGEVVRHPRPGHAAGPRPGWVVVPAEGEAFLLDSTPSYDVQLAAYARAHGLPPPPPLGW